MNGTGKTAANILIAIEDESNEAFYANSKAHGFWDDIDQMEALITAHAPHLNARFQALVIAEKIALIHSELSEALEAVRTGGTDADHHVPQYSNFVVELADARIRLGDLAARLNLPLAEAMLAKHRYNLDRPYKHGKQS